MRAANLSKECSEEKPLAHSTHLVQQATKLWTQPRSQLCDLTVLRHPQRSQCNNTGSNTNNPSQQLTILWLITASSSTHPLQAPTKPNSSELNSKTSGLSISQLAH